MAISNPTPHHFQTKKHLSFPLLASMAFFLMLLNRVNSSDSLSFTFNNFQPGQRELILQGDAQIPYSTGTLQLTKTDCNDRPVGNSVGRALYNTPVRLWDSATGRGASFETSFTFRLTSPTTASIVADGITFFIAPPETTVQAGSGGGLLGLFTPQTALNPSLNQVVAVEFDTFSNTNWDPSFRHIGIDVNTIRSSATVRWDRINGSIATARVSYDSASNRLSVVSSYPNSQQYTVSHVVDLKTILPEWVRIGFSGSTGESVQNHNILSWSFSSSLQSNRAKKKNMLIARYV